MHTKSLIKRLLKIDKIVIEDLRFETVGEEEILVIEARPLSRDAYRCPKCGRRCTGVTGKQKSPSFGKLVSPDNYQPDNNLTLDNGIKNAVSKVPRARGTQKQV